MSEIQKKTQKKTFLFNIFIEGGQTNKQKWTQNMKTDLNALTVNENRTELV